MNISEFEKPANEKLAKINEALDTLYGFRVYDTIDIKKLYDVKKDLKTKLAELEASLPFNTANTDPRYMKHVLLAEAIDQMIEAKKKDHDKDGDIDSDDYLAARDKAIKKAMGKDKKEKDVKEELTDKQKKLPPALQKAIKAKEKKEKNENYDVGTQENTKAKLDATPGQSSDDWQQQVETMQKKNASMREALAKVWGVDEGKNPFKTEGGHLPSEKKKKEEDKTMTGKPMTKVAVDPDMKEKKTDK